MIKKKYGSKGIKNILFLDCDIKCLLTNLIIKHCLL